MGSYDPVVLRALAEMIDDPVMVADASLRVVAWNGAAARHTGYRGGEVIGAHCLSGLRAVECVGGCPIRRGELSGPAHVYHKDGRLLPFRRSATVLTDDGGQVVAIVEKLIPATEHGGVTALRGVTTRSPRMRRTLDAIRRIATLPVHTLIVGEPGTCTGQVAAALHAERGLDRPEVRVRAGEPVDWRAVVHDARGTTLVIEAVDHLSPDDQAALARCWPDAAQARIVATAGPEPERDLAELLLYRLRGVTVHVPALRDRTEDLVPMAEELLASWSSRGPRVVRRLAPAVIDALRAHRWPGNERELEALISHAYALGSTAEIELEDLPDWFAVRRAATASGGDEPRREQVRQALVRAEGRVAEAAESLGMSRSAFWRLRRKLGL